MKIPPTQIAIGERPTFDYPIRLDHLIHAFGAGGWGGGDSTDREWGQH